MLEHRVGVSTVASYEIRKIDSDYFGVEQTLRPHHTIPFLNSSSGYLVPRQIMPSFHSAWNMESSKV